jgi:phosphoribosylaminoimidazolecarboxamide formyltransferase/IMP cyclohydrolase
MKEHGILPIDMVVVNLYPFEATVAKPDCSLEEAIENIDIGGPTMLRSAAKNNRDVTVIVDSGDYQAVLEEMGRSGGSVSKETNFRLAVKVYQHTAAYDAAISNYLGRLTSGEKVEYPDTFTLQVKKAQDLRYGENPHQSAAFFVEGNIEEPCVSNAVQHQGKELSFNNIIDLDGAIETVKEFQDIAAVIIKHTNPCGIALSGESVLDAYLKARACDPFSAFGGIIGFNRIVDEAAARELSSTFLEAVIAPGYSETALEIFKKKKNVRIMEVPTFSNRQQSGYDLKRVVGGLLLQERDRGMVAAKDCKVVTKRQPTEMELKALDFAWKVCKHVKSNAIVFTTDTQTVGIGAGQMSRVDSSKIAVMKAQLPTKGTVLASDAFFPFRDGVDAAVEAGVTAIIQPGGSIRDEEVIGAANENNVAMVFTGMRHFRH